MALVKPQDIGTKLCKVMGLEATQVHTVDLHIAIDELVTADIVRYVTPEEMDGIILISEDFVLLSKEVLNEKRTHSHR